MYRKGGVFSPDLLYILVQSFSALRRERVQTVLTRSSDSRVANSKDVNPLLLRFVASTRMMNYFIPLTQ
jgi:hypothetical protein